MCSQKVQPLRYCDIVVEWLFIVTISNVLSPCQHILSQRDQTLCILSHQEPGNRCEEGR